MIWVILGEEMVLSVTGYAHALQWGGHATGQQQVHKGLPCLFLIGGSPPLSSGWFWDSFAQTETKCFVFFTPVVHWGQGGTPYMVSGLYKGYYQKKKLGWYLTKVQSLTLPLKWTIRPYWGTNTNTDMKLQLTQINTAVFPKPTIIPIPTSCILQT